MSRDWRESIGLPNTFRNCVSSIYLPYGAAEQDMNTTPKDHTANTNFIKSLVGFFEE